MPTSTVENYVKQIYLQLEGTHVVPMGELATAMDVVPGTATTMVKSLADAGLVHYEPRQGVSLTTNGRKLALHVLRRHRLIELFLVKIVGLDWSEVHDEAEELEHAISDKVLEKMDDLLGRPSVDPHGDPIPPAKGKPVGSTKAIDSLATCAIDSTLRIARVLDQNVAFLQFVERCNLAPGATVRVVSRDPQQSAVVVKTGRTPNITLGLDAATKILVEAPM